MHYPPAAPCQADPMEGASRDELAGRQLERLKWSLKLAYENVPHYRAKFDAIEAHPDDLRQLSDLARFPFTTKDDLRQGYPFGMFAVPRDQVVRVHASSGTTGKPTVVGYTQQDVETWAGLIARCIRAAGGRRGDIVHVAFGYGLFTGGLGAHYGAEKLGCTVIPISGGQTERQVKLIADFKPDIIMATPSYTLVLGEEMRRQGMDPRQCPLRIGMHGAEPWSEAMRQEIEQTFDMRAVDLYGLSEIIGPGVASECADGGPGLTLWEDHFYPEIIDPKTGQVLPDGEFGELVLTSLTKQAMPMVRYRTRDLTRLLPPVGRPMRRIERISGRSDDMLIVHGVNVFPSQIEELILADKRLSPHYVLELRRKGHLDALEVVVERRNIADATGDPARDLAHHVKSMIGISVNVRIVEDGSIERSLGKAKRVLDFRPKD